jgi:hypothetical protein
MGLRIAVSIVKVAFEKRSVEGPGTDFSLARTDPLTALLLPDCNEKIDEAIRLALLDC